MCGIAGHVRFDGPPDASAVRRMVRALRHRGPDGDGVVEAGAACLGHTRLALVDAAGGAQPFVSADGRHVLVFDGEVYGHDALRGELAGSWTFRTRGDTEVVLAALATWGEAALDRLDGMFALCLWDRRDARGLLARDRLGVKPLLWASAPAGGLVFASEAKAILAAIGGAPRARADAILEYLTAPCFSGVDTTPFEGIERLPAGGVLRVDAAGATPARWSVPRFSPDPDAPHAARVRAAVVPAVRRALRGDAPVGAFLSGGVDSTLVCAIAGPVPAYTVRFSDHERVAEARSAIVVSDDVPFARLAADALPVRHRWVDIPRATLAEDLREVATTNDLLPAWEQEIAQRHLARAAAREVKAVLVGDAADETHWGYPFLFDDEAAHDPAVILRRLGAAPIRRDRLARPIEHFAARYVDLATHPWDGRLAMASLVLDRWLGRLLHNGDVHAMAFSLEARVPFADPALVAAALAVPPEVGFHGGVEKSVLREAARGLIPEAIRTRRKSAMPKDHGAGAVLQAEAALALDRARSFLAEYLDVTAVRALTAPGRPVDERERATLFRVTCLAHWSEVYGVRA